MIYRLLKIKNSRSTYLRSPIVLFRVLSYLTLTGLLVFLLQADEYFTIHFIDITKPKYTVPTSKDMLKLTPVFEHQSLDSNFNLQSQLMAQKAWCQSGYWIWSHRDSTWKSTYTIDVLSTLRTLGRIGVLGYLKWQVKLLKSLFTFQDSPVNNRTIHVKLIKSL